MAFSGPVGSLARVTLVAAVLPLIALQLGAGHRASQAGANPWILDGIALATPLGLFWALNHPALDAWWIRDDPCHLVLILEHGIWRPFVSSIGFFLTPLLPLSLGIDFSLFGLEPTAFYGHQLVSFSMLIVVGYGFLRAFLTPAGASLALALFVVSVPAFAVARLLMNRHYLEGLILALAGLALYRRSITSGRYLSAVLAAVFYLLATTAKEVFVPLVVLLPFLAAGDRSRRWRHAVPFVLAAGVYGIWRLTLLGWANNLSGYGALGGEPHLAALLGAPRLLGLVRPWQLGIAVVAGLVAVVVLSGRSRSAALAIVAGLVALAAPLIPVATRLEPRHLFLWAFAAAALLAAVLDGARSTSHRAGASILWAPVRALAAMSLLLLALVSLTGSPFWRHMDPTIEHHRNEGSFVLDSSSDGLLLTTVNHSTFLQCLAQLRREVSGRPGGPGFCGDACFCSRELPDQARWRYADSGLVAVADSVGQGCATDQPLEVEMAHDQARNRMSWTFGPYSEGTYEVLLISGVETPEISIPVVLPRQGSMPYWLFEPVRFVVKYRSLEGWQTYSPVYSVEPDGRAIAEP